MALPNSLTIAVKFDRTTTPASFKINDITDYSGLGLDSALVVGNFRIVDPNLNVIHNNTNFSSPDIDGASTLQYSDLPLPLDINGEIVQGTYIFDYSIKYDEDTEYSAPQTSATYSDIFPEISIEVEVDCFCGRLESIDETSYGSGAVINERTHTVVYPAALNIADVVSQNATIVISPIYTQTWTTIIETNLTYTFADGSTVDVILTGSKETIVDCDLSLCQISCCLLALNNRYLNNRTSNPILADQYLAALNRAVQLVQLFKMAQECGQGTAAANALSEIRTVADCTEGCGCGDSTEPQQIIPLCSSGGSSSITVVGGTGITVNSSVVGSSIQYSVAISTSIMNIINSLAPVNIVGGTGITVVKTTPGGVDTYTVTNNSPSSPLNTQEFNVQFQYSNFSAPTVNFILQNYIAEGDNMQSPTISNVNGSVGVGNWKNQNNLFSISDFQVTPNTSFKIFATIYNQETQDINGNLIDGEVQYLSAEPIDVRILQLSGSGSINFQFVYKDTGIPVTNYGMVYYDDTVVQFLIKE